MIWMKRMKKFFWFDDARELYSGRDNNLIGLNSSFKKVRTAIVPKWYLVVSL